MENCSNIPLVSAYYDGQLDPSQRTAFEQHLIVCGECAEELEQLQRLSSLISQRPESAALSNDVAERLHRHVDELTDRSILRFAELLSGVAAAVLLMASIWAARPANVSAEPVVAWDQAAVMLQPSQVSSAPAPIRTVTWMVSELTPDHSPATTPAGQGNSFNRSQR